ncbi:hypothetical protein PYCC9005_003455 [Savitreella phatthalungensis]
MSVNNFFLADRFAVAGASADPAKYGYKVLRWYKSHELPVTPINPKEGLRILDLDAVTSLEKLDDPQHTAVSVITPPKITLPLIDTAEKLGVPSLWLQPGTFDEAVVARIKKSPINIIAQGRCILVEGSEALAIAKLHGGKKL